MDELVQTTKLHRLQVLKDELAQLQPVKAPWYFRRRRYLEHQISRLQFELGQYSLTGKHAAQ